jgi:hypothetical protein
MDDTMRSTLHLESSTEPPDTEEPSIATPYICLDRYYRVRVPSGYNQLNEIDKARLLKLWTVHSVPESKVAEQEFHPDDPVYKPMVWRGAAQSTVI